MLTSGGAYRQEYKRTYDTPLFVQNGWGKMGRRGGRKKLKFNYSWLLTKLQVFKEYFKELEEESIRDNFVIIYELMDEMMDFGYPQITEPKILQEYVE